MSRKRDTLVAVVGSMGPAGARVARVGAEELQSHSVGLAGFEILQVSGFDLFNLPSGKFIDLSCHNVFGSSSRDFGHWDLDADGLRGGCCERRGRQDGEDGKSGGGDVGEEHFEWEFAVGGEVAGLLDLFDCVWVGSERTQKEKGKKPAEFIVEIGAAVIFRLTDTRKPYHHLQIAWMRDMG